MTGPVKTWRRMRALLRKETLQILRDRATLGMLLGIPLLQIIIFGFAIELTPHTLFRLALVADENSGSLVSSPLANLIGTVNIVRESSIQTAERSLARGGDLNLIIDVSHHPPTVYIDASNPIEATVSELRIEQFLRAVEAPIDPQGDPPAPIRVARLYNPHVKTQPYLLTGLLGAIPTLSLVLLSALSVARERERKTLQVLRASPARFFETACGKLLLVSDSRAPPVLADHHGHAIHAAGRVQRFRAAAFSGPTVMFRARQSRGRVSVFLRGAPAVAGRPADVLFLLALLLAVGLHVSVQGDAYLGTAPSAKYSP